MNPYMKMLDTLTARVRKGDVVAAQQLHRELEPNIIIMVRQTMQPGGAKTPWDGRIRAESRRAGLSNALPPSAEREQLIRQVAQGVCRSWIAEQSSPPRYSNPQRDTIGIGAAPSMALAY